MLGANLEELHQTITMFEHNFDLNLCSLAMIVHIWPRIDCLIPLEDFAFTYEF